MTALPARVCNTVDQEGSGALPAWAVVVHGGRRVLLAWPDAVERAYSVSLLSMSAREFFARTVSDAVWSMGLTEL